MSVRTDTVNLNININGNQAQADLNNLRKRAADIKFEMEGLKKGTAEYVAKAKELKEVNAQMSELKKTIGITSLTQKELVAEMKKLQALKGSLQPFTKEWKELDAQIKAVDKRLYDVKNGVQGFASFFSKIKDEVKAFGVMAAGYLGFQFLSSQFTNIISGAGKMSDQLAAVRKTTGLTADQVKSLNSELKKMDTRTSTSELRSLAIEAGKLGIQGKDNILGFIKAADQIKVALGEDLGKDAITQIGKLVSVFRLDEKFGLEQSLLKTGSAINELGAASAASEGYIVDFTSRLAGIAPSAKISIQDVAALGATLDSLGIQAELGSTAVGNVLSKLVTDFKGFAAISGQNEDVLRKVFNEKGALEALKLVLAGVKQTSGGFDQFINKLGDVGVEGSRAKAVFGALADNLDKLDANQKISNKSFEEGTSITKEFQLQNETFGATLDKLGKQFNAFVASPAVTNFLQGAVESCVSFLKALAAIPGPIISFVTALGSLIIAVALFNSGMIQSARLALIQAARTLAITTASYLYATALTVTRIATSGVIATQAAYITVVTLLRGGITLATAAQRLFNIALTTGLGPLSLLLVAVGAVAGAVVALGNAFKGNASKISFHNETLRTANEELAKEKSQLDTLTKVISDNSVSLETRKQSLKDLIAISPEYLNRLTLENVATKEGKDILDKYNKSLEANANLKAASVIKDREFEKGIKLRSVKQELEIAQKGGTGFGDLSDDAQAAFSKIKTSVGRAAFTSSLLNSIPSAEDFRIAFADIDKEIQKQNENVNAATENLMAKTKEKQETRRQFLLGEITAARQAQNALGIGTDAYVLAGEKYEQARKNYYKEFGAATTTVLKDGVNEDTKATIGLIKELQDKIKALDDARPGLTTEAAIKKNLEERKKLQAELDRLEGKTEKKTKDQSEYARLKKEAKEFYDELKKMQARTDAGINPNHEEVVKVSQKYSDLLAKAQNYYDKHLIDLNVFNEEERIIVEAALKELNEMRAKTFDQDATKNYEAAIKSQKDFTDQLKDQYTQMYVDGTISKKEYDAAILASDKNLLVNLIEDAEAWAKFSKKAAEDVAKFRKEKNDQDNDDLKKKREAQDELSKAEDLAGTAIKLLTAKKGSKAEFEARKEKLKKEEEMEVQAEKEKWAKLGIVVDESSAVIQEIHARYRKENLDLEQEYWNSQIDKVKAWAEFAVNALTQLNQVLTNIENAKFAKEKKQNEEKAKLYKKQLDEKLISQAQYDKKIQALKEEEDKRALELKRKQAKREKALNLFSAIVNVAGGVAKALNNPYPLNIVLAAIAAAAGAVQIATIASQPLPTAAKGKYLETGDRHSAKSGGIPIMAEQGEAVITRDAMQDRRIYTISGTPKQITSRLNSQAGGVNWAGGAVVHMASWIRKRPEQLDRRMPLIMKLGGIVTTSGPVTIPTSADTEARAAVNRSAAANTNQTVEELLRTLITEQRANNEALNGFNGRLKADVSLSDLEQKRKTIADAKRASGIDQRAA